jgi:hypothetical protein
MHRRVLVQTIVDKNSQHAEPNKGRTCFALFRNVVSTLPASQLEATKFAFGNIGLEIKRTLLIRQLQ